MKTTKPKNSLQAYRRYRSENDINQVNRILNLYHCLPRFPLKPCPMDQLKTEIQAWYNDEIDEQSIRKAIKRDLSKLEKILVTGKLHIIPKKGNRPSEYYLSEDASIEKISSELALVLVMANDYLRQYLPYQVYEKVEGFFKSATMQLEQNTQLKDWPNRIRFVPASYYPLTLEDGNDAVENIYTALLEQSWMQCEYRREGELKKRQYMLKPHGIIQDGHKQYLMASKLEGQRGKLKTFNMQRFDKAIIDKKERIAINIDTFDLDELVEAKEHEDAYFEREELLIKLRCENDLEDELQSYPIDVDQEIIYQNDEHFILEAKCIITTSLLNWFIEKSHSIQVIEPRELFEKVKVHVLAAQDYYDLNYDDLEEYQAYEREENEIDSFFDDELDAEIEDVNHDSVELDHE
ncbi:WYL domain-containing protein [Acinetobacter sp. VNH17]|uniref:WYL domain-containing protein n=1 Tax=Acinetobacter thutiue TaxID=2998078 RepID=A0ABT7WMR2_9GAMM|nr:WYL domain-containing protein [Acinetobacter thutiue]MCY6411835.1 WYL domain-containing protein [Acinetobacter thutiue]MDN0013937.1 WYL domain-containing protein [Acinetobacter thutiue]